MKKVFGVVAKILFYVFVLVVLFWTASLTLTLVKKVLPGDALTPFFALALFDGGAITWLLVFMFYGRGLYQRAIALTLLVVDLIGVVVMSGAELFLGGQTFTEVPANLGEIVVWAIGIWTALNVIAAYAFHIADPETIKQIEIQSKTDEIQQKALEKLELGLDQISNQVAVELGERMRKSAMIELGVEDLFLPGNKVVDAQFNKASPSPAPHVNGQSARSARQFMFVSPRRREPIAELQERSAKPDGRPNGSGPVI